MTKLSTQMRAVVHLGFSTPRSVAGTKEDIEKLFFHHLAGMKSSGVDVQIDDSMYDLRLRNELQEIWTTYYNILCDECRGSGENEEMESCQSCNGSGFKTDADFTALAKNMPRLFKIIDTLRVEAIHGMGKEEAVMIT